MHIFFCTCCHRINIWTCEVSRPDPTCKFCDREHSCRELSDGTVIAVNNSLVVLNP